MGRSIIKGFKKMAAGFLTAALVLGNGNISGINNMVVFSSDNTHNHQEWVKWDKTDCLPNGNQKGKYYLSEDVTIINTWEITSEVELCLNGHSITYVGEGVNLEQAKALGESFSTASVIAVESGSLRLFDETDKGTITGGKGTFINKRDNEANQMSLVGAGVYIGEDACFEINGGCICDNVLCVNETIAQQLLDGAVDMRGAGVGSCIEGGELIMNGGSILDNYVKTNQTAFGGACYGAGVSVNTVIMNAGSITSNYAVELNKVYGGGLYVSSSATVNSGVISDNKTSAKKFAYGAGIYCDKEAKLELGGATIICDNRTSVNGIEKPDDVLVFSPIDILADISEMTKQNSKTAIAMGKMYDGTGKLVYEVHGAFTNGYSNDNTMPANLIFAPIDALYCQTEVKSEGAQMDEANTYVALDCATHFELSKNMNELVQKPTANEGLIYNGQPQVLCDKGQSMGGIFMYKLGEDGVWSSAVPTGVCAGEYTVYYYVEADENYSGIGSSVLPMGSVDVSIAPFDFSNANVEIELGDELHYNGEMQTQLVDKVFVNGVEIAREDYFVFDNNVVCVDEYTLTVNGTGNYTGTVAKDFEMFKSDLANAEVNVENWTYGDIASPPTVTGNVTHARTTYLYKPRNADDECYVEDIPTEVGEYTVKATIVETDNYARKELFCDFSILPKDASVAKVTVEESEGDGAIEIMDDTSVKKELEIERIHRIKSSQRDREISNASPKRMAEDTVKLTIVLGGRVLNQNVDYEVAASNSSIVVNYMGNYTGTTRLNR